MQRFCYILFIKSTAPDVQCFHTGALNMNNHSDINNKRAKYPQGSLLLLALLSLGLNACTNKMENLGKFSGLEFTATPAPASEADHARTYTGSST